MLTVEDWAEIRRLHRAEGLPIKMIARVLGISKNTVKSALESNQQPKYERAPQGSIVDAVEPRIRELLQAYPTMPATVIAERIGWERSIRGSRRGWPSCARCICRRTRRRAPRMWQAKLPSATSGFRRSSCR
ncbi:transposase [Mycobacterium tuberculosis]|nr:transposase [Mycobacterium tuberculosis]REX23027.1 transposase [Mycobacterium tuberculosis]